MDMMNESCSRFLAELASKAPTPGGGGTAALVGAAGVALGNMVGCLTVGKKKYAAVEADLLTLNERAGALRAELEALVQADAEAFAPAPVHWAALLYIIIAESCKTFNPLFAKRLAFLD